MKYHGQSFLENEKILHFGYYITMLVFPIIVYSESNIFAKNKISKTKGDKNNFREDKVGG